VSAARHNAATYFVDRHRSGASSQKSAFVMGETPDQTLTYGELADKSDLMASLFSRHGINREDRAAVLMLDTLDYPVVFWGSLKAGVVPVLLNTLLASDVYDTILRDCRARALFVSSELLPVVEPVLKANPYIEVVFVVGENGAYDYLSYAKEIAGCEPQAPLDVSPDECAFWLYSSGSTGAPKGVCHVHSSLKATADTYGDQVLGIQRDDIIYSAAKIFFAYGLGNAMTFPMSVGATTVLLASRPTPEAVLNVIGNTRPTLFCGVPTLYGALLAHMKGTKPAGTEQIRRCISAGEALPEELGNQWKSLFGTDILDGVGSTEMLHIFLSNSPGDVAFGTSGTAVPGYELRLVDEDNKGVATGEVGELLVRGPSAAERYWNQRDKSRATFEGEWTRTGDKYEQREDGRYIFCGRTDDMFKVSGIWVSPFEVEQALVSHPSVLEAAVVAAADDSGLDKPKAFIVLMPDAESANLAETLKEHVKQTIGKWKYPRWIEIVDDLPKTATGKIQRFKLRD